MFLTPFEAAVRVVLSAAVLLASSGMPVVEHAHAGGDERHRHEHLAQHSSQHRHDHDHDHAHVDAQTGHKHDHAHVVESSQVKTASDLAARHRHMFWFGIDFNLPCLPADQSKTSSYDSLTVVLPADARGSVVIPVRNDLTPLNLVRADASSYRADNVGLLLSRFVCITADAAPLCDSARHERSGVLLS